MAFYSVHKRDGAPAEAAIFVPEGFSFGAFVFGVLWALWHRMWMAAAVLLAISGAIAIAGNLLALNESVIAIVGFTVNLIFGFEARDLQIRSLISRGYDHIGVSHGKNIDEAEIRYFHNSSQPQPQSAPPVKARPYAGEPDTLGIFGNV